MNTLGGNGLWDEEDGFYYDQLKTPDGRQIPLRTRSLVGLIPLIAVEVLETAQIEKLPGFKKRMEWFLKLPRRPQADDHLLRTVLAFLPPDACYADPRPARALAALHAR